DTDQLVRAEVERASIVRSHDAMNTFDAIVDVHERAGLPAVSPDLDRAWTLGARDLSAHRRRCLFTTAIVGAERSVNILEAHDTRVEAVVFHVVLAEFLSVELFEAVTLLRLCGKCVFLAQRCHIGGYLQAVRIDASG